MLSLYQSIILSTLAHIVPKLRLKQKKEVITINVVNEGN